jgi:hypothetical protein
VCGRTLNEIVHFVEILGGGCSSLEEEEEEEEEEEGVDEITNGAEEEAFELSIDTSFSMVVEEELLVGDDITTNSLFGSASTLVCPFSCFFKGSTEGTLSF